MKPVIGLTSNMNADGKHEIDPEYMAAIVQAGGLPIIIPADIEADVGQMAELLDGLLLTGGKDINPMYYEEEPHPRLGEVSPVRDRTEIALVQQMVSQEKPVLGICRGIQLLNVACGGDLFQDIECQIDRPVLQHAQKAPRTHPSHTVKIEKGSLLEGMVDCGRIQVNSFHHQAVKRVAATLRISAFANDGVVEAIEGRAEQFVLGVQWHPERLAAAGDAPSLQIFNSFIQACLKRRDKS
ncbi:gamma-glutamyl-gamma-aminobutyrate hydrolase family protein [Sporosarcina sp. 179-K 3D1 HS]|uniref:gamma-glutamyl-gamma-aminobutyrate hydrolase family protein n=1 Tax=Sporosarcina sp. 179-K 3D1 HS TaxID=3232169 RepID=UPI0039A21851